MLNQPTFPFDEKQEEWRTVIGYEGLYEVSNLGRVRSVTTMVNGVFGRTQIRRGRILRIHLSGSYPTVVLSSNGEVKTFRVHRLVLEAFVGSCPKGMECRHFPDRNTANNRFDNLSWGTPIENAADRDVHGTSRRGKKMPKEAVERIANLNRGRKRSPECITRMRMVNLGKIHSEESVARMAEAQRLRYEQERASGVVRRRGIETRIKMAKAQRGRRHSQATKEKMVAAARERWAKYHAAQEQVND